MHEQRTQKVTALVLMADRHCACGVTFRTPTALPQRDCPACVDLRFADAVASYRNDVDRGMGVTLEQKLRACGMGSVEMGASLSGIPESLKKKLPAKLVRPLIAGAAMAEVSGFGLSGGQGVGKTMALAAILRTRTREQLERLAAAISEVPAPGETPWHAGAGFLWVNWPDQAAKLKTQVMERDGGAEVERFARRASGTALLVLDDLGRERLGRNYDEDYAFGILDRIIDARSRAIAPILWTSNLSRSGIATRYGAALTSRLLGLAPAVELPRLPDIRLS